MVVAHNLTAMNSNRQFKINTGKKSKTAEKLTSGYRINRAADDAAGLAISEKMRKQIRGLQQGVQNTQDGISLCQVADGALAEVHEMLQRANELAVQAANGTNSESDRKAIQMEVDEIKEEIDRISDTTKFNEKKLFYDTNIKEIKHSKNIVNNNSFGLDINVTGTPNDTSETMIKIVTDSVNGFEVNGRKYSWKAVINENGNTIDESSIKQGIYSINYNGVTISFEVQQGTKLEDISKTLNNTSICFKSIGQSDNYIKSVSTQGSKFAYNFLTKQEYFDAVGTGKHTISLIDYQHISIKNDDTGMEAEVGIGLYKINDSQYKIVADCFELVFEVENGTTSKDIFNAIDGATFYTSLSSGNFVDYTGSISSSYIENGSVIWLENNYKFDIPLSMLENLGYDINNSYGEHIITETMQLNNGDNIIQIMSSDRSKSNVFYLTNDSKQYINSLKGVSKNTGDDIILYYTDGNYQVRARYTFKDDVSDAGACIEELLTRSWEFHVLRYTTLFNIYNINLKESKHDILTLDYVKTNEQSGDLFFDYDNINISFENSYKDIWIQSGAEAKDGMYLEIDKMNTKILGIDELDVTTQDSATESIDIVEQAIAKLSKSRSKIGAQQNRLEHTVANENNIIENTTAAESRIRDTDMSKEMVRLSMLNVLEQANTSIMAQTNQSNQGVLSLLNN